MESKPHSERGQSLVELAVMLPLLAVIVFGAVDVGRAFFAYGAIANAAREGALYASLFPADGAGVQAAVAAELGSSLAGPIVATVSGSTASGGQVTVTVDHTFQAASTVVLGTRGVPLRARAVMVVQ